MLLGACQSISYYAQAVEGHVRILAKQTDIQKVINDERVNEKTRQQLQSVLSYRQFAISTLKLPENKSYTRYADLNRDYVVWNVVATPQYSVEPVKSCFPIVGCLSYRGYYDKQDAIDKARQLKKEGLDVHVGGVSAYSTLGWFTDPMLNTMLRRSDAAMAGLIFHEMAHQQTYIKDDTKFNESFATAVESIGLRQWASMNKNSEAIDLYFSDKSKREEVIKLILSARQRMQKAYLADENKLILDQIKKAQFVKLSADYHQHKLTGGGTKGFDRFFKSDLNNASLALFAEYHGWLNAFENLFKQNQQDWHKFYNAVKALGKLPKKERETRLAELSR